MTFLAIHPLHLGSITRRKMVFGYFLEPDVTIDAPVIGWYIEGANKKILVDTGGETHPRWQTLVSNPTREKLTRPLKAP